MSRSIGILLDNALEATLETTQRQFWITIQYSSSQKSHVIKVGNSVKNAKNLDVHKMFEKGYSTKLNGLGIGLCNIHKFIEKYNKGEITSKINESNNTFIQELLFYKK